jgi:hypothetical protein
MTSVDSGDRFWKLLSDAPFDPSAFDPEAREVIEKSMFLEPLPNVKRLIFLSTPHHGSYIAGNWLAHQLSRLIALPADITRVTTEIVSLDAHRIRSRMSGTETSVLDMTPGHPFIETLWSLPIAPDVKAHSIVAVTDPGEPRDHAGDGVVEFRSAHIEGVESELVVTSPHSCQDNPHTIAEVRRILLEHLAEFDSVDPQAARRSRASIP